MKRGLDCFCIGGLRNRPHLRAAGLLCVALVLACAVGTGLAQSKPSSKEKSLARKCMDKAKLDACVTYAESFSEGFFAHGIQGELLHAQCAEERTKACAERYLKEHSDGPHVAEMRDLLDQRLREEQLQLIVAGVDDSARLEAFRVLVEPHHSPPNLEAIRDVLSMLAKRWRADPSLLPFEAGSDSFFAYFSAANFVPLLDESSRAVSQMT